MSAHSEALRGESWASIPTDMILAELRRRKEDGEKPECGSRTKGSYDTTAHVFALILILALSTLACGFPLISRRTTRGRRQKSIIFYCQHIGTGVLLATAFVHLLPTAFESMTDPCLPYFFSKGYTPMPGLVAMVSAIVVVAVESYLTARGAGHSHSHNHGYFDSDDEHEAELPVVDTAGLSERRAGARPPDIHLEDMETQGLVAGVSPLPESTPVGAREESRKLNEDFNDADSDLGLDMEELDPGSSSNMRQRSGQYASLKPGEADGEPLTPMTPMTPMSPGPQSPEEQQRKMLQCVLLEAGILFHSVFIGMAISVATGPAFVVFLVAISFHQTFEGLALGSRIAAIQFPRKSIRPWLMVLAYGTTTPIGQAIGLVVHRMYDPKSAGGLLVVGFMNAVSSGLLLYAGLVQLLAEDFLTEKSYKVLKGKKRLHAFLSVCAESDQIRHADSLEPEVDPCDRLAKPFVANRAVDVPLLPSSIHCLILSSPFSISTMPGQYTLFFFGAQVLFAGLAIFLSSSPYVRMSSAPTQPWADGPMKLVVTPQYETKKTDLFTTGATHMALLHNAIIRGFNSIYLQAPHVKDADKAAFIGYSQTWFRFVKSHHDDEEDNLFPKVKDLLGDEAVWAETHEEHESFLTPLAAFNTYISNLTAPTDLDAAERNLHHRRPRESSQGAQGGHT
ncbi:hypothetical protein NM208_g11413 [Fusarium decemcellulare]|uniref:Uncharacterized protein n=1 Tax=Fusarium decemcellulare TaxID=57161 RepID=A0ACC1RTT5_9HYPO|nr:hypothetical protein NM208_g11413 [Fusarium decemcellulare]